MQTVTFPRRRILQLAGLGALALAAAGASVPSRAADAPADAFAGKTIKIIVPFTAGGSSDIIARAISTPLAEALKATVVVDNKVGANGNIGADFVAKSAPNGLTLLMCDVRALAISPSLYTQLPFDPSKKATTPAPPIASTPSARPTPTTPAPKRPRTSTRSRSSAPVAPLTLPTQLAATSRATRADPSALKPPPSPPLSSRQQTREGLSCCGEQGPSLSLGCSKQGGPR